MIPFSLYIKEYSWSYDQKYYKFSYYFLYISASLNLKYLKLTKMELSRFAMKLFIFYDKISEDKWFRKQTKRKKNHYSGTS